MNRFNIARNLVLLGTLALGGCFAQGDGPEDVGQTGSEARHVVATDEGANAPRRDPGWSIVGTRKLGVDVAGAQPEPWSGFGENQDGDNSGPQPEPWVPPSSFAPDHGDKPAPK